MKPSRLLTSRKFAAGLMVTLVVALLLSLALQGAIPGMSQAARDSSATWSERLSAIPQPYGHVLVFLLTALTVVALASATVRQSRIAWKRTIAPSFPPAGTGSEYDGEAEALAKRLRSRGWIRVSDADENVIRLVRNPWSMWAGVALHVGLIVIMLAATTVVFTGRRATVSVRLNEEFGPGTPVIAEVHGPLATQLTIPGMLQLVDLNVDYAPNRDLRQITSSLVDTSSGDSLSVAVNAVLHWRGLRVYQSQEFGPAYTVEFGRDGEIVGSETIEMLASSPAGVPTYRDIPLPWGPELLRVRSVVSSEGSPELTLRLQDGDTVAGETPMVEGQQAVLGEYAVKLQSVTWWNRLIFVEETGIPFLFFGFLLAGLAGILLYAAPVREIYIRGTACGAEIVYRASRFPGADDERRRVLTRAGAAGEADA